MRGSTDHSAVVCDCHPIWLEALEDLLEGLGIHVVGSTIDQGTAVGLVEEHRPDLLVLGIDGREGESAFSVVRQACDASAGTKAVVLSERDEAQQIEAAFAAGATVYCVKTAEKDDLRSAIRQAFRHSIYLARGRTPGLGTAQAVPSADVEAPGLTKRELEILQLVAEGLSNSQLAKMLWVTEQTVKFHLSNIYRKLDVSNRTEASRWAQLHGLLPTRLPETTAA